MFELTPIINLTPMINFSHHQNRKGSRLLKSPNHQLYTNIQNPQIEGLITYSLDQQISKFKVTTRYKEPIEPPILINRPM